MCSLLLGFEILNLFKMNEGAGGMDQKETFNSKQSLLLNLTK